MSELKEARLRLGLTQVQMAALMGMAQGHYARIETARAPTKQHWAAVRNIETLAAHGLLVAALEAHNAGNNRREPA